MSTTPRARLTTIFLILSTPIGWSFAKQGPAWPGPGAPAQGADTIRLDAEQLWRRFRRIGPGWQSGSSGAAEGGRCEGQRRL